MHRCCGKARKYQRLTGAMPKPGNRPGIMQFAAPDTCAPTWNSTMPTTAAFIIEPLVQGAAGMGMYDAEYLRQARAICDEFNIHLIADEIAVGFGRTGTMFAFDQANIRSSTDTHAETAPPSRTRRSAPTESGSSASGRTGTLFAFEQAGIRPDFMCLSKGITGGYLPLSAVLTTDEVFQAFYHDETAKGFLHSHSYTGNALACRAALATLDIFEQDKVIEANRLKAAYFNQAALPLSEHPRVKNFRHTGMIWAFEVESSTPHFSRTFYQQALQQELLLRPMGNTVYFMPPYIISEEEIDLLISRTLKIVDCV